VNFHVGKELITAENIYDGKVVESLIRGKRLHLQCVQNEFGVEGRRLDFQTPVGYNGVVHVVDEVLYPPVVCVEDLVKGNNSFR
jgi:uncharacterized surface protein with fasciclin (FAS1) repeats